MQNQWNRREFLRFTGAAAGAALLAACNPVTAPTPSAQEAAPAAAPTGEVARFAYVGTYTRSAPGGWSDAAEQNHPKGIAVFTVDPDNGAFTNIQTAETENPSFLAIHPSGNYLYAINEIADYEGQDAGSVEAYAIDDATGEITLLNRQAVGAIPAHLAVDPTGKYLVVANYVGASFQVLPINDDGSLGEVIDTVTQTGSGPNEDRQSAPHPHCVMFDPAGNYIATADLGIDKVQVFKLEDGKLVQVSEGSVAPGSGPRHLAFHPSGQYLYAISELVATVTAFAYDAESGQLGDIIQTISTVPEDFPEEKSTAEIMVHQSGKFLYGSNRGMVDHPLADSIAEFSIDEATGELTLIGHATEGIKFPRGFNLDPTGTWLYAESQKGDTIGQFAIDQTTGALDPTGAVIDTPVPVSLVFKQ